MSRPSLRSRCAFARLRSPVLFAVLLAPGLLAQAVHYELAIADVDAQTAVVRATFPAAGKDTVELFLPVWSPGFYRAQDYSKNVMSFNASGGGTVLAVEQPRPNRWRIATNGAAEVTAAYTLHCARASVTENQIASDFAVFCGPATFVGEVGAAARAHSVHVTLPPGWAHVATGMAPRAGGGADEFTAPDYDRLLDAPIVLGAVATTAFDVLGARHEWAQFGNASKFDAPALVKVLQPVTAEVCRTFGAVPFEHYVFLAGFRNSNGGLEHLDSALVTVGSMQRADDTGFLSFLAHEYTHAFNVKRLRPVELGPFDYENPPRTDSLWIAEGLTTWFGELALARAGVIQSEDWLRLLTAHVQRLQRSPGRVRQTLADASNSVWQSSNSGVGGDPRTTVSYYVKGPVVGFLLDARLRKASDCKYGLDELMRRAYAKYSGTKGFTPAEFEAIAAEVAGSDQRAFFDAALRSTAELDYDEALEWFGLGFLHSDPRAEADHNWELHVRGNATPEQRAHLRTLLAPSPALSTPK